MTHSVSNSDLFMSISYGKYKGCWSLEPKGTQSSKNHLATIEAHRRPGHHRMVTTPLESKENCRSTTTSPVGIFFNYGVVELTFQWIENLLLKSINFVVSEFVISTGFRKLKIYIFLFFSVFPLTTRHSRAQIMSRQLLIAIPGIDPSHVGCVLDSVVLGEVSLRVHPHSPVKDFPIVLHTHSWSVTWTT